jgi:hypothetical protein
LAKFQGIFGFLVSLFGIELPDLVVLWAINPEQSWQGAGCVGSPNGRSVIA